MGGIAGKQSSILESVDVGSKICDLPGLLICQAKANGTGEDYSVIGLLSDANEEQAAMFERIMRHGGACGLTVERADQRVILASPCATGSVAHLPSLGWRLQQRLGVFTQVAQLVRAVHHENEAVGPLDPEFIMLDSELCPFLLGPRMLPLQGPYAAPESIGGGHVDRFADIFSLGKLLHFLISQETPNPQREDPPRLDSLMTYPAGLSRIVRRATMRSPASRYGSVDELLDDVAKYGRYEEVGLVHPGVTEQNFAGLSHRPPAMQAELNKRAKRENTGKHAAVKPADMAVLPSLRPFEIEKKSRNYILIIAAVCAVVFLVLPYFVGNQVWVRALLGVAMGAIGFSSFSAGVEKESSLRAIFAVFFGLATFMFFPTNSIAKLGQASTLNSADPAKRLAAFNALKDAGQMSFVGLNLAGADLSDAKLFFVMFEGVSFENTNLSRAHFINASLKNVRFKGADLSGAVFQGCKIDGLLGFDLATCSETTQLPPGWHCTDEGNPKQE